ncbi:sensor histidine kinase [Streptomyces sp. H10-C2]|uniref:sensor histidine kinase n=1 Tax=unclassified Streptomyces TaxID=2593676 RepID=UPI0024BA7810|nr:MULTISPECIES: sensor histidine kinase [unclassified Streptomyces]MDJ0342906.1 sensor histidine kinase [Streptomyces sp. PH10-H1]MDJ0372679.1 sensor histidine kinase [Streptomyces sp. H10-C2]
MTHQESPAASRAHAIAARFPWISSLAVAFVQVVGSNGAAHNQSGRVHLDAAAYVLLLAGPALLPLRHRAPVLVAAGTAAIAMGYLALGYPYGPVILSMVVAFFAAIGAGRRRAVLTIAGVVYAVELLVGQWLYRWLPPEGDGPSPWMAASGIAAWLLAILAGAELYRARRERIARERRDHEEAESRRADEERLRIARELHDVLAHSISVINVQAGVALALMDERPEQARSALITIKAASKEALGEVRQVLSTLRAPGDAPRSPAPGLDRLSELAEQAAGAGLKVDITTEGARFPLSPGADLAAFRIIQEALTNIVRHSGARTARVRLEYGPEGVELSVDDDGPSSLRAEGAAETGGGNGLLGMRERAAALGGSVEAGPRPGGGFRVLARLPRSTAGTVAGATEGEGR